MSGCLTTSRAPMVATSEVSASIPSTLPGPWLPFCLPWHSLLPLLLSLLQTRRMATAKTRATCAGVATASSSLRQPTDHATSVPIASTIRPLSSETSQSLKVYLELLPFLFVCIVSTEVCCTQSFGNCIC